MRWIDYSYVRHALFGIAYHNILPSFMGSHYNDIQHCVSTLNGLSATTNVNVNVQLRFFKKKLWNFEDSFEITSLKFV